MNFEFINIGFFLSNVSSSFSDLEKLTGLFLIIISISSWVIIISKGIQLFKIRKSDIKFNNLLRKSTSPFEIFKSDYFDDKSLHLSVYNSGAYETAFLLCGYRNPSKEAIERIHTFPKIKFNQIGLIKNAFDSSFRSAILSIKSGIYELKIIGVSSVCILLIGIFWILMNEYSSLFRVERIDPKIINASLGLTLSCLFTASPAFISYMLFKSQVIKKEYSLKKFRNDISRLFIRNFIDWEGGKNESVKVKSNNVEDTPKKQNDHKLDSDYNITDIDDSKFVSIRTSNNNS